MKIEPTYVTFEQAKWFKEKGFDVPCYKYYDEKYPNQTPDTIGFRDGSGWTAYGLFNMNTIHKSKEDFTKFSAPEQYQVVEWLRINHGIWVEPNHCGTFDQFAFKICKLDKNNVKTEPHHMTDFGRGYDSPQEAYSAAFDYIIKNNLI